MVTMVREKEGSTEACEPVPRRGEGEIVLTRREALKGMLGAVFGSAVAASTAEAGVQCEPCCTECVDLIECNHFHDEHGKLVFDQIIFLTGAHTRGDSRYVTGVS